MTASNLSILELPDIFMISVFKHFTLKELLKYASVCKKWNQLIRDGSLWRRIDLRPYKLSINLCNLQKLIDKYATDSTKQLYLLGNYVEDARISHIDETSPLVFLDTHFFSDLLLFKSSQLTYLSLDYLDLSAINFNLLCGFERLVSMSLAWCNLSNTWFQENDDPRPVVLERLSHFYLIRCSGRQLDINDVRRICTIAPGLKTLCINQSQSSLRDDSIEVIVSKLGDALENLSLNNTLITDESVLSICNSPTLSAHLKTLNLARSSNLTNRCLEPIGTCLVNLKSLYLTSCFGISNALALASFGQLNYLNLNNTSIDKEKIRECLVPALKQCEIEFGHEKMLNRKLMWTINGSRNCVCSF